MIRSGRFDKIIHIQPPTLIGRKKLFEYYLKNKNIDKDLSIDYLAKITMNSSGSDIKNLINLALINSMKFNRKSLIKEDFIFAADRLSIGV